jgi:hypothetical protein
MVIKEWSYAPALLNLCIILDKFLPDQGVGEH